MNVVCSFILTYGLPMAFAARELWLLNRDEGRRGGGDRREVPPAPKPLPDCLIPKLGPHTPFEWERDDDRESKVGWESKVGRELELV
jgi:hypothetical protein